MFLIGGIGFSRTEIPDIIGSGQLAQAGDLQMNLYINFGGGLEFKIARKLWMYVQIRYLDIAGVRYFGEDMALYPLSLGIRF
ncbi:MAG: hypothetical protein GY841_02505 [FCB group bacterium]|nr:hypothetical protein [FCB group bacterium]